MITAVGKQFAQFKYKRSHENKLQIYRYDIDTERKWELITILKIISYCFSYSHRDFIFCWSNRNEYWDATCLKSTSRLVWPRILSWDGFIFPKSWFLLNRTRGCRDGQRRRQIFCILILLKFRPSFAKIWRCTLIYSFL